MVINMLPGLWWWGGKIKDCDWYSDAFSAFTGDWKLCCLR